jgi:hypothetical protein
MSIVSGWCDSVGSYPSGDRKPRLHAHDQPRIARVADGVNSGLAGRGWTIDADPIAP